MPRYVTVAWRASAVESTSLRFVRSLCSVRNRRAGSWGRANAGAVRGASDFLESCVGDVRAASCHMVSACDKVEKPLV